MTTSQTLACMRMESKLFRREPMALFFTLAFPVLLLLIFGSIWGNAPVKTNFGSLGYISLSLPGFIGMIVATSGLLTLSASTASYREIGFFRLLRTTPLTPCSVLLGQVATLFLVTIVGVILLVTVAVAAWDAPLAANPVALIFAFCEGCLAFYSFGFLLAALVPTVRSVQIVSMALFFPMLFLSGAAFPSALLPPGIRAAAQFLPLTPLVSLFNGAWFGGETATFLRNAVAIAVFASVNLVLISRTFRWDDRDTGKRATRFAGLGLGLAVWIVTVILLYRL